MTSSHIASINHGECRTPSRHVNHVMYASRGQGRWKGQRSRGDCCCFHESPNRKCQLGKTRNLFGKSKSHHSYTDHRDNNITSWHLASCGGEKKKPQNIYGHVYVWIRDYIDNTVHIISVRCAHILETAYFTSKQNRETRCIDVKIL